MFPVSKYQNFFAAAWYLDQQTQNCLILHPLNNPYIENYYPEGMMIGWQFGMI